MTNTTNTPLHVAAQNGNIEIVKMLLNAGHDPSQANAEGLTPLHLAVQMGHNEIVALLAEKTKPQNRTTAERQTPPLSPQSLANHLAEMPDTPPGKAVTIGAWLALAFFVILGVLSIFGALLAEEEPAYTEKPKTQSPQPLRYYHTTPGYTSVVSGE